MTSGLSFKSVGEIKADQEKELQQALSYLQGHSPFYQGLFKKHGIDIREINTLENLAKIPFTSKEDLQRYNEDFLCVPKREVADFVTTSGTLGSPVSFALTDSDLDRLALNEAHSFACAGVQKGDTVQLMTTMDRMFMAGLAYFLGARKLGAGVIRVGSGIPELQWDTIRRFGPKWLICVPSFLLKLIRYAEQNGIEMNKTSVKGAICIGEPILEQDFSFNNLGRQIAEKWDIPLYSTYASTEMSTAFTECGAGRGGHLLPDLIIAELIGEGDNPVAPGEVGELVVTTLGVQGMPLLRFRTGDMVQAHHTPCTCGRNTLRLGPVVGRKQQMVKYKGTTLYPPAMHDILNDMTAVDAYVIELFQNETGTDEILLKIASKSASEPLMNEIKDHFRAKLRVAPHVEFCPLETVQKLQLSGLGRKPLTLIDRR